VPAAPTDEAPEPPTERSPKTGAGVPPPEILEANGVDAAGAPLKAAPPKSEGVDPAAVPAVPPNRDGAEEGSDPKGEAALALAPPPNNTGAAEAPAGAGNGDAPGAAVAPNRLPPPEDGPFAAEPKMLPEDPVRDPNTDAPPPPHPPVLGCAPNAAPPPAGDTEAAPQLEATGAPPDAGGAAPNNPCAAPVLPKPAPLPPNC
jgi:hypothetical protein